MRLTDSSEALATARQAMDWVRADAERTGEERRRDRELREQIERRRRILQLETGLEPVPPLAAEGGHERGGRRSPLLGP